MRVNGYHLFAVGPMGQEEEGYGPSAHSAPIYAPHVVELGRTEVEGASVEHDGTYGVVCLPQSATPHAAFAYALEVAMEIDVAELKHPVLRDDEFAEHQSAV